MPDANGNIKGFAHTRRSAAAWERIFSPRPEADLPLSQECEGCGVYGYCPDDEKETP